MALTLNHQTVAQFVTRLRKRIAAADKLEKARLATWLYDRFAAGDITQAQIRTAFDLDTTAKWEAFRDKIIALRDYYIGVTQDTWEVTE